MRYRAASLCIALIVTASPALAQHSHGKMRGMLDYGDTLFISAKLKTGTWTCASGSTTCTGSGGAATTDFSVGDAIELQTTAGDWRRYSITAIADNDTVSRGEYYGTGDNRTQDLLYAVSGSTIYLANDGLTSEPLDVFDGSGNQSPLQLSTTDIASTTIALTAGASVAESADGYLVTGAWAGNLDYTDFSAAATINDITLVTLPAKAQLMSLYMVSVTPATFSDTYTLSVGSSSPYDQIILDSDGKAAANTVYGDSDLERGADLPDADHMASKLYSYTSTQVITVRADGNATNLDQASAGEWRFILVYTVLP